MSTSAPGTTVANLSIKPLSLGQWIHFFDSYFAAPNRGQWTVGYRPLEDFVDRLAEIGGYITSPKHQSRDQFRKYYAKYFAWYCGLVSQAQLDLPTALWTKFPNRCPYCGLTPCAFVFNPGLRVHNTADPFEIKRIAADQLASHPALAIKSLSDWFTHFITIYPTNLHGSLGAIAERFHEEQSELIKAIRESKATRTATSGALATSSARATVLEELSDLLAWFLTLGAKVLLEQRHALVSYNDFVSRNESGHLVVDFDDFVFGMYREGCPNCHNKPCTCRADAVALREDLKVEVDMQSPPQSNDREGVVTWLRMTDSIDLSTVRVVGRFVAGTPERRDALRRNVDEIRTVAANLTKPYSVLVCGGPGVGKTFFVNELASDLGLGVLSVNFAGISSMKDAVADTVLKISAMPSPRLAFLDEIDTKVAGEWAYRFFLAAMKGEEVQVLPTHKQALPGVVLCFAASAATDFANFKAYLSNNAGDETIIKGPDFARRFSEFGIVVELPTDLAPQDKVMQFVANVLHERATVRHVEARVLLYFAERNWENAGALKGAVTRIMRRVPGTIVTAGAIADEPGSMEFLKSADAITLRDRLIVMQAAG